MINAVTGWLLFTALISAWGAITARVFIAPRAGDGSEAGLLHVARRVGIVAGWMLPVAMAFVFYRQLTEFRDPFATWQEDVDILLRQTSWGRTWLWGAVGAFVVPLAFHTASASPDAPAFRRLGWWLAALATALMCAFPGLTGHASSVEGRVWLSLPADILHVLAAGSWIGGLVVVLATERAGLREGRASRLPTLVPLFSPIAVASVAVLVLTGTLASWLHVETWRSLVETSYGRILLVKLALVALVLGLGALNWKRLSPRLQHADGPEALRRAATLELIVAHLVILVTALLVRTSPLDGWSWANIGH